MLNLVKKRIGLKGNQSTVNALKTNYGIGASQALTICKISGVKGSQKLDRIKAETLEIVEKCVESRRIPVNRQARKNKAGFLEKLVEIKSYRGLRLVKGYPARGQRTHSNARTSKKKLWNRA